MKFYRCSGRGNALASAIASIADEEITVHTLSTNEFLLVGNESSVQHGLSAFGLDMLTL